MDQDRAFRLLAAHAGARQGLIVESHARLTGRPLIAPAPDLASALWEAPFVVLAHGAEPDPVFFYANRVALDLFELTPEALMRMPSRLSAEPVERAERERLLETVARQGFIDDYAGVRVSSTGRRFRIEQATVWNLVDQAGVRQGQAATFARWTEL